MKAQAPSDGRVVFLDVARVLATLMMLMGHTVDALLSNAYRGTTAFNVWTFFRGMTPSTFTFVSGFALSLVALHISRRETAEASGRRRLRRFAFFLALGYALHFPVSSLRALMLASDDVWRIFTAVDVLQCIAVTLTVLQLLALRVRDPRAFTIVSASLAAVFCAATPLVWRWSPPLPLPLAAYFNTSTGSLFPLFPWLASGALGAAAGARFLTTDGDTAGQRARRTLLVPGLIMLGAALAMRAASWELFGAQGAARPSQFLLQSGLVCLLLTTLGFLVDLRPARIPRLEDFAQESLTIYVVHLCLVYGSPWNGGLRQLFGPTLEPPLVALLVVTLWTAMIVLGLAWSAQKRNHPTFAAGIRMGTLGTMLVVLLA